MIGDVFLVRGGSKFSTALVSAQKAIYPKAKSSHVELHLGSGTLIHSTGDLGVHLKFLLDELQDINLDWRVIRLKGLTDQDADEISKAAIYFLRQGYNKKYMGSGVEHASFCSELIAKIYQRAGIPIIDNKKPSKVAPAHFDKAAHKSEMWEDVTHEYESFIHELREEEGKYRFVFSTIQNGLNKRNTLSEMRKNLFDIIQKLSLDSNNEELHELIEKSKKELSQNRLLDFWDENDTMPYEKKSK